MSASVGFGTIAILLLSGLSAPWASAQVPLTNRITAPIRSDQMQAIPGTMHPLVAVAQDRGELSGSTPIQNMALVFGLSPAQQADLKNLIQEQQTKGSPMYHQWLRPGQFAARYGVSQQDLAKVAAWLQSEGFAVTAIPASDDQVVFSGTAAQVNAAFLTQLHRYFINGTEGWANSTDISLPRAIAGMAPSVEHLNTFRPLPQVVRRPVYAASRSATGTSSPHYTLCTSNTSPCPSGNLMNFIAPSDMQTIYDVTGLYNNNVTGSGQTLAVAEQTDIVQYESDIANFRSLSGLNASNLPTQILVPNSGTAQAYPGDLEEADIDTEWAGAVAKDATILAVTVGNSSNMSVFDSLKYAIQTPLLNKGTQFVPVISISYGACERSLAGSGFIQTLEQTLEQANAQGQTVIVASGDSGSADCDAGTNSSGQPVAASQGLAVDYPSSSQYVTAAGGTSFSGDLADQAKYWNTGNSSGNGSVISYIPETTWNDTPNLAGLNSAGNLSASGGGASNCVTATGTSPNITCTGGFTKPSWQVGPGVPSDGKRDVPDISLAADPNHDGYVLCTQETNSAGTAFTGTSSCVYPVSSSEVPYFDANGNGYAYGGTSIVAPQVAAMITLWNQKAGNTSGVGNANPILYQTAQSTPAGFHDVTTGSNAVVCVSGSPNCNGNSGGYGVMSCCNAATGYDMATGLGSVDAAAMGAIWPHLTEVNGSFSLLLEPAAVSVAPGSSATTKLVLSPSNGFNGAVTLTCSNMPAGVTCSFAPSSSATLSSGTAQTVTLTISASSSAAATSVARSSSSKPFDPDSPMRAAFAGILGLALLGMGRKRRYFPSRWMAIMVLAVGLMAATALTACGGGSAGAGSGNGGGTPVTHAVTVTGTSGSTVASATVQLTVT